MSRIDLVVKQICSARGYTEHLLEDIQPDDWFRQPAEGVTHVAWQVGHLAIAEYRLALERVRGPQPRDAELISGDLLALFGRGSVPDPDPGKYPKTQEIRAVFDRVHQQTVEEVRSLPEAVLDEPTDKPHPMFHTKIGALDWCAQHEMLHAGQIGLLRRLFGREPLK